MQHQKQTKYFMLQIKNFPCCVVKEKFRNSFVLPKKYSVREINNFPNRYKLTGLEVFWVEKQIQSFNGKR